VGFVKYYIKYSAFLPKCNAIGCIITLPGRGKAGESLARIYANQYSLNNILIIGFTPPNCQWYPLPKADNQTKVLEGMKSSRKFIKKAIKIVRTKFNFKKKQIALVGFSAGAVMAIQIAAYSKNPYAAVVSHSGAIFNRNSLPCCVNPQTLYLLTHNQDDNCFSWQDRYIPMKKTLIKKGYHVKTLESHGGGHMVNERDWKISASLLSETLSF
jgi:predicted esterase